MHSIISMVGIVLTGKENYLEWSCMIKHTLIFNEMWKGVCIEMETKNQNNLTQTKCLPFGKIRTTKLMH